MFTITNRHGVQVAEAETFIAAMRLVDHNFRTDPQHGPYRALPVKAPVTAPAKRLTLTERFFGFFGVTN